LPITSLVLLFWLALCAGQDARQRQISNLLTLGAAACALAWLLATGHSWTGAQASDADLALAVALLLSLPGYWLGQFGAGDVKLLGALALASSQQHLLLTIIGAGAALLLWGLLRRMLGRTGNTQPFAPFVLVGFLIACVGAR